MSSGSIFFYTFRTNKFVTDIEEALGQKVYVIDRYSKDFDQLKEAVKLSDASVVCGIGISRYYTRFEKFAFNRIGNHEIVKGGPERIKLSILQSNDIESDSRMTFGPCNYVAYRLSVETNSNQHFLHIRPQRLGDLRLLRSADFFLYNK